MIKSKKDEMGGACSTHAGDEKCKQPLVRTPDGKKTIDIITRR
jgi:hypothetical protein